MTNYGVLIAGELRAGRGPRVPIVDPSRGKPFAELVGASKGDVDEAVRVAKEAFETSGWRDLAPVARGEVLFRAAIAVRARGEELAQLETRNVGRPIAETRRNSELAADDLAYYAGVTQQLRGSSIPIGPGMLDYTVREPLGVCAQIIPWNNPLNLFTRKVAPALAAGNAVVAKPSGMTPASALLVAQILQESGLPPGQLNVVPGSGGEIGNALIQHNDIAKISFTGSTAIGKEIARLAADRVAHVSLELGGKSPSIIFRDADLLTSVQGSISSMFVNTGQTCTARSRILVQEDLFDEFLSAYSNAVEALRIGDPFDDRTQIGPVASKGQLESVMGYVDRAVRDGATAAVGGRRLSLNGLAGGFYMEPTILTDVHDRMESVCEEIFGPVVVVDSFKTEGEAITRANETPYGLAASVWTSDLDTAHRVASRIQAGTVTVNTSRVSHVYAPFGGYKESGTGRELGLEGVEEYLQIKNIVIGIKPSS